MTFGILNEKYLSFVHQAFVALVVPLNHEKEYENEDNVINRNIDENWWLDKAR